MTLSFVTKSTLGLAILLATICTGVSSADAANKAVEPMNLTIGVVPSIYALPLFVAQEEGIFKKVGLNVNLEDTFTSGAGVDQSLIAGAVDAGFSDTTSAISLATEGQNVTAVVGTFDANPFEIIARAGLHLGTGVNAISKFNGLTMGVSGIGAASDILLGGLLKKAGVDPNRQKIVAVGGNDELAALGAKTVDVIMSTEPATSVAIVEHLATLVLNVAQIPGNTGASGRTAIVVKRDFYTSHPTLMKRLYTAIDRADALVRTNLTVGVEDLAYESPGLAPAALKLALKDTKARFTPEITKAQYQASVEQALSDGIIKSKSAAPSFADIVANIQQ
jgi:NitT/TauT family transport system substrate-binding protein